MRHSLAGGESGGSHCAQQSVPNPHHFPQNALTTGSVSNVPLRRKRGDSFVFEVKESRNDAAWFRRPLRRNDFAAVVLIRDHDGGFGRYHFRLSWDIIATSKMRPAPDSRRDGDERRSGGGFVWNNVLNFHGEGRGSAVYNDSDMRRLMGVNVDIDRGGRLQCPSAPTAAVPCSRLRGGAR